MELLVIDRSKFKLFKDNVKIGYLSDVLQVTYLKNKIAGQDADH